MYLPTGIFMLREGKTKPPRASKMKLAAVF
jgi:hypothetical protein